MKISFLLCWLACWSAFAGGFSLPQKMKEGINPLSRLWFHGYIARDSKCNLRPINSFRLFYLHIKVKYIWTKYQRILHIEKKQVNFVLNGLTSKNTRDNMTMAMPAP